MHNDTEVTHDVFRQIIPARVNTWNRCCRVKFLTVSDLKFEKCLTLLELQYNKIHLFLKPVMKFRCSFQIQGKDLVILSQNIRNCQRTMNMYILLVARPQIR